MPDIDQQCKGINIIDIKSHDITAQHPCTRPLQCIRPTHTTDCGGELLYDIRRELQRMGNEGLQPSNAVE